MKRTIIIVASLSLAACALFSPQVDRYLAAQEFLAQYDQEVRDKHVESATAAWVQATHITPDTQALAARASERFLGHASAASRRARSFADDQLPPPLERQRALLERGGAVPSDPAQLAELTQLASQLEAMYGSGRYCPPDGGECQDLGDLEDIIDSSRDPAKLLAAWSGWREVSPPMQPLYSRFVELKNQGAREIGYADAGALWRGGYDMPADEFTAEVERLWTQVQPLYEALHCEVRAALGQQYGQNLVPQDQPIPAHLLGNMWAQQWGNLAQRMTPYPGEGGVDITAALVKQGYDAVRMVKQAEGFYTGLGMPALPESFYQNSLLTKPRDREVVCHASAWDIDLSGDVRIKMCIEPNADNLLTIYHELGHIYYDLAYNPLPYLFQSGAHDGFHEAVGDTMMLALTPGYLQGVGLAKAPRVSEKAVINEQMRMALDKVAFLPFGLLVDKWRWQVFSGAVPPAQYNAAWWQLRQQYQGIRPPNERPADAFDPGAKYHIPGDTPYMRYFLAHILQFQFYEAMCATAGFDGPLHACTFAGSEEAGAKMWAMLQLGQSQPWPDALEKLTGTRQMDGGALLRYFAPLKAWLDQRNATRQCGW